jgi:hypothetical protein
VLYHENDGELFKVEAIEDLDAGDKRVTLRCVEPLLNNLSHEVLLSGLQAQLAHESGYWRWPTTEQLSGAPKPDSATSAEGNLPPEVQSRIDYLNTPETTEAIMDGLKARLAEIVQSGDDITEFSDDELTGIERMYVEEFMNRNLSRDVIDQIPPDVITAIAGRIALTTEEIKQIARANNSRRTIHIDGLDYTPPASATGPEPAPSTPPPGPEPTPAGAESSGGGFFDSLFGSVTARAEAARRWPGQKIRGIGRIGRRGAQGGGEEPK